MKKFSFFLFSIALAGTTFLASCSDDDTGEPDDLSPSITLGTGGFNADQNVTVGDGVAFQIIATSNASSNSKIVKVEADRLFGGVTTPWDTTISSTSFNYTYSAPTRTSTGAEVWTFTATDKDGETASITVTLTWEANTTPMATTKTGQFYHVGGSLKGAYDLKADVEKGSADAATDKDMTNSDVAPAAFTGSWTATNGTMYVKDNSFDYTNATLEGAAAAYIAGSASATVTNPAAGDIYIAYLRGGSTTDDIAVVKISSVAATDNTCSCANKGKISFEYKKK